MGLGKSRSVALGFSNLRCLLDIRVEISGRQLAMRVSFGEVVQDKDINLSHQIYIICV